MRVLALASYDSFLNIACLLAPHFERAGCQVEFAFVQARRREQISERQVRSNGFSSKVRWIDIESFCSSGEIADYDIVLSCLEGLSTRRLMHYLIPLGSKRPLVISAYPGLVLRYAYDGFSMRAGSDLLWLNCEADAEAYHAMCNAFGIDGSNARVFGVGALLEPVSRQPTADAGPVVFFEQAIIPRHQAEREFLAEQLVLLTSRFPQTHFIVKPRTTGKDATLHRSWYPIDQLLKAAGKRQGGWPENLSVTSEKASVLLTRASHCLTVCSTVAAEAIHAGIPTAIIGDFGAHDDYGLHYFYGSGLIRTFAELEFPFEVSPRANWQSRYVGDPNGKVEQLVAEAVGLVRLKRMPMAEKSLRAEMSPELRAHLQRRNGTSAVLNRVHQTKSGSHWSTLIKAFMQRVCRG
ncbi:DUF6716 putative glycosyltransferase (plasmid) [Sinorhizobium meliloti]|uniref:DUF6716 putative glycosyltransferase n=1 Tax=Rhizobium meliloti TaxID=382 RepID=UPI000D1E63D7|nr:DUF6716 putative glycosyltransferase [Sinorhizobium meliloti]RMI08039.1 hypothetical protein DA101_018825 [Sinorhizobium meliloti]WQO98177.1 DUF6716 putative glycosyltransferase [Sinorhizobium meliloti]